MSDKEKIELDLANLSLEMINKEDIEESER